MKKVSAIALVCGVWLSGSVAFAGSAADWIDAEVAANQNAEAVQMMEDETFEFLHCLSAWLQRLAST